MAAALPGAARRAVTLEAPTTVDEERFPGFVAPPRAHARSITDAPAAAASPVVLGLAVFILLVFSRGWITLLVGPDADAEGSSLIRNLFVPGYGVALLLLAGDPRRGVAALIAGALPFALVGLALASTLWSFAPDLTLRRAIALLLTTLAGCALAARLEWRGMARAIAGSFVLLALGSAVVALALPHVGKMDVLFPGAWRGLWSDKNALGDYMALGVCACAGAAVIDRRLAALWAVGALLCLMLIVFSTSRTSLVSLAAGLGAFGAVALGKRSPAAATAVAFALGAAVLAAGVVVFLKPHLLPELLGKDATLTGRTVIWETVLRRIAERPVTGFGYGVVWTDATGWGPLAWIAKEAHFIPHHAHNSWLEAELDLGYAGVGLLALFAVQTLARVLRAGEGAWIAAPMLAAFAVATLTETVTLNYNDFLWVIVPALAMRLGMKDEPSGAVTRTAPSTAAFERPWPT